MAEGESPERLRDALTTRDKSQGEGGERESTRQELSLQRHANQVEQRWEDRSHEELVRTFHTLIQQGEKQFGGYCSPEEIVRFTLSSEEQSRAFGDEKLNEERSKSFFQLRSAWDALAYESYETGSNAEKLAGLGLSMYYNLSRTVGDEPVIKLSPRQTRIIDALTEAADIPHQKEQVVIEIPKKLRNYSQYVMSEEYQERWARAKRNK
jgi:hypothetical protein